MRLEQLFEDIHSDQSKLSNAKKAFDDLMFELKGHVELLGLDEFDTFEKSYLEIMSKLYTYTFKLKYKDEPITVRILPQTELDRNRLGVLNTTSVDDGHRVNYQYQITIFVNPHEDFDLISANDFYRTFAKSYQKVFVHEFVHFIDAVESDNQDSYTKTKRKLRQKGKYINTPQEYNAFYIQMMSEIDDAFEDSAVMNLFKKDPSFDKFLSIINVETHAGEMLKDLEGKYKKAFKKRLYQLYNHYLGRIEDQDTEK